jgi:predicted nucleic acid-binding protein
MPSEKSLATAFSELTFRPRVWAEFSVQRTRPVIDTFLAATAVVRGLTLVTRNERDFHDMPLKLLNPWKGEA